MMYVLETHQPWRASDISESIRLVTDDPRLALEAAKKIQMEEEDTVREIRIFLFEPDKLYAIRDHWQLADEPFSGIWMYTAFQMYAGDPWYEKWNEKFRELVGEPAPA